MNITAQKLKKIYLEDGRKLFTTTMERGGLQGSLIGAFGEMVGATEGKFDGGGMRCSTLTNWEPIVIFGLVYYFIGGVALRAISVFFAFCLVIYTGFVLLASRAISFWNNPLLPILFVSVALGSGVSLMETINAFSPQDISNHELLKVTGPWLVTITALLILVYLLGNLYSSITAKESVIYLVKGRLAPLFYTGVVFLGIILPLVILISAYFEIVPSSALAVAGISELIGAFILRYSIMKAGMYAPIA